MESLYKTQLINFQPLKTQISCLLCEKICHIEDTYKYEDEYSVCINCSEKIKKEYIIQYCREMYETITYNDTKNIKSVYLIRCKCFKSHNIIVDGLRNIGVQDYNNIFCKCQTIN